MPGNKACPQYASASCCTAQQDAALSTNFALIYSGFELLGGNAACVANIEAFWCAYSCAGDQARFITVRGVENMTDPINGGVVEVLHTAMTIDADFACGIFESCRLTFTSELASFTTCEQFLDYQVSEGVRSGAFTDFVYTKDDAPGAFSTPLYDCCSYPAALDTPGAPGNVTAPCAYCQGSCGSTPCYTGAVPAGAAAASSAGSAIDAVDDSPLYGFQWAPLAGEYGAILAISLAVLGVREYRRRAAAAAAGARGRAGKIQG